MALPTSTTNGATATINGIVYTYNSTKGAWYKQSTASTNVPVTISGTLSVSGNANVGNLGSPTVVNGNSNVTVTANSNVSIAANGAVRVTVDANGNVGVGNSADNSTRVLNFTTTSGGSSSIQSVTVGATNQALTFLTTFSTLAERMRITGDGNVGIGSTSPKVRFQATGAATQPVPSLGTASGTAYITNSDTSYGILAGVTSGGHAWMQVQRTDTTATAYDLLLNPSGGNVAIGASSATQRLLVTGNAQVTSFGVGTAASGTTGEIRATNAITAFYSDSRLKDIKGTIPDALDKLITLDGVIYTQNATAEQYGYMDYSEQVGVIAQQVQRVLPQVVKPAPFDMDGNNVSVSGENYLTVQYEKLIPLLIESIKQLNDKVNTLEAEISELKGR